MICGLQTLQETEAGPSSIWTQLSRLGAGYSTVKNSGVLSSQHAQWSFGIHFFIPCSIWLTDLISWYLDYFFSDTKSLGSTELEEMLLKGDDSSHIICWRTQLRDLWNSGLWGEGHFPVILKGIPVTPYIWLSAADPCHIRFTKVDPLWPPKVYPPSRNP